MRKFSENSGEAAERSLFFTRWQTLRSEKEKPPQRWEATSPLSRGRRMKTSWGRKIRKIKSPPPLHIMLCFHTLSAKVAHEPPSLSSHPRTGACKWTWSGSISRQRGEATKGFRCRRMNKADAPCAASYLPWKSKKTKNKSVGGLFAGEKITFPTDDVIAGVWFLFKCKERRTTRRSHGGCEFAVWGERRREDVLSTASEHKGGGGAATFTDFCFSLRRAQAGDDLRLLEDGVAGELLQHRHDHQAGGSGQGNVSASHTF